MTNMVARNDTIELEDALKPTRTTGEPRGHSRRLAYNDRQPLPGNEPVLLVTRGRARSHPPVQLENQEATSAGLTYNDRQPLRGEEQVFAFVEHVA